MSVTSRKVILSSGAVAGAAFVSEIDVNVSGKDAQTRDVTVDSNDNIILVGRQAYSSYYGPFVIKLDSDGAVDWGKINYRGSAGFSDARGVVCDSSDNIYFAGSGHYGSGNAYEAGTLVKYNSTGTRQFDRKLYKGSADDAYRENVITGSTLFMVGTSRSSSTNGSLWMTRYNTSGTKLSSVFAATPSNRLEVLNQTDVDSSGNVYAIGVGRNSSDSYYLPYVAKWDSSGTLQWQKTIDDGLGTKNVSLSSISVDDNDNVYLGGQSSLSGSARGFIAKVNAAGTAMSWIYEVTGTGAPFSPSDIATDSSGNIYYSRSGIILKITPTPSIEWTHTYTRSTNSAAGGQGLVVDSQDNIIHSGYVNATDQYPWIMKMTSDGLTAGTYGDWTIADLSLTLLDRSSSLTWGNGYNYSYGNYGGTEAAVSFSEVTYTLDETIIDLE